MLTGHLNWANVASTHLNKTSTVGLARKQFTAHIGPVSYSPPHPIATLCPNQRPKASAWTVKGKEKSGLCRTGSSHMLSLRSWKACSHAGDQTTLVGLVYVWNQSKELNRLHQQTNPRKDLTLFLVGSSWQLRIAFTLLTWGLIVPYWVLGRQDCTTHCVKAWCPGTGLWE